MHVQSNAMVRSRTRDVIEGDRVRRWLFVLIWATGAAALMIGLGRHAVTRSQEARVLVTAREMIGQRWDRWLIPHTNGHVRLRKPPLAYWLTATSFSLFGVGEWQGRLPAAVASLLTVGITFHAGRYLFGWRAGVVGSMALLSCIGFGHYARLAETDPLVMLFVTAATYAVYRGYDARRTRPSDPSGNLRRLPPRWSASLWFHAGAAAMALALLTKGPAAGYAVLFLVVLSACERHWAALRHFVYCGAPLTFLVIGAPWFAFVMHHPEAFQLTSDLHHSAIVGGGHADSALSYIPQLLLQLLPWSAYAVVGIIAAVQRWRRSTELRAILVWILSILLPLCLWSSKQPHYLLPLLPPLMLVVAWLGNATLNPRDPGLAACVTGVWRVTLASLALAAPLAIVWSFAEYGSLEVTDLVLCLGLLVAVAAAAVASARFRAGLPTLASALVIVAQPMHSYWRPILPDSDSHEIARQLDATFGDVPFVFYRGGENLPLCFYLAKTVPSVIDEAELRQRVSANPHLVVLQARADDHPLDPPAFLHAVETYRTNGRLLTAYR